MRSSGVLLALLASALVLPPAQAALVEDPAGDVQLGTAGGSVTDPTSTHSCIDLLALDVTDDGDRFLFTVTVGDVSDPPEESPDGCAYAVLFEQNGREFQLYMTRVADVNSYQPYASLGYRDDPADRWTAVWRTSGKVDFDPASDTLSIFVPRAELADADDVLPYAGRSLERLHVNSASRLSGDVSLGFLPGIAPSPVFAADRMPDGEGMGRYEVTTASPEPEVAVGSPAPAPADRESPAAGPLALGLALGLLALARRR